MTTLIKRWCFCIDGVNHFLALYKYVTLKGEFNSVVLHGDWLKMDSAKPIKKLIKSCGCKFTPYPNYIIPGYPTKQLGWIIVKCHTDYLINHIDEYRPDIIPTPVVIAPVHKCKLD